MQEKITSAEAVEGPVKVKVEGYSGYKADERPLRFCLGERWYEVLEVLDRWYGPDYSYFRVRASDGSIYILRLAEDSGSWELTAYRPGER